MFKVSERSRNVYVAHGCACYEPHNDVAPSGLTLFNFNHSRGDALGYYISRLQREYRTRCASTHGCRACPTHLLSRAVTTMLIEWLGMACRCRWGNGLGRRLGGIFNEGLGSYE